MDRLFSRSIFDDRNGLIRRVVNRVAIRFGKVHIWFKDKSRQIRSLPGNDDLIRAVFSAEKAPVEGSRYRLGERINVYHADGESRRFKICGIQSGGFSNVYIVIDLDEMKPYCLKENRAIPGDEHKKNSKLKVEALISLRLGLHPNLVTTYAAFFIKNRLFLLTEYVPATSLDLKLKADGPLSIESALKYAVHICRGLSYAEAALPGFIHGDIKPGNCLLASEGRIKLCDFGLASAFGIGKTSLQEKSPGIQKIIETHRNSGWGGTSPYMAPEMFDRNNPDRQRADIYAFGVTLFEMLCGMRPSVSSSKSGLIEMHRRKGPLLDLLDGKNIPPPIVDLILRCLSKLPDERPESFASIEVELKQVLENEFEISIPLESAHEMSEAALARVAMSFAVLGRSDQGAACIDSFILQQGKSAELLACKAITLTFGASINEAYEASTAALMMRADLFIVLLAHARVLIARDDLDTAANYLHRALRLRPENGVALNLLGGLFLRSQHYNDAGICFDRSLTLDDSQAEPWEALANINFLTGRREKAMRLAEKAASLDPHRADSHRILGDGYLAKEQIVDAIMCYKTLLRVDPFTKETTRRYVRACCELYKASGRNADLQLIRILILSSRLRQEADGPETDTAEFAKKFSAVLKSYDFDPLLIFFMDSTFVKKVEHLEDGLFEKFSSDVQTVWRRSAERVMPIHVLFALGRTFYEIGSYDDCRSVFQQGLDRFGPNEIAYYYLAACSEIRKDFHKALEYYRKASQLGDREDIRTGIQRVTANVRHSQKLSAVR